MQFRQLFNIHVKGKQIQIHPKMVMIWTYENMVHFKSFKVQKKNWLRFFK
jgi:hypothetical protein